jgi:hypothetical protein
MFICSVTAGLDFGWVAVAENSLAMMLMCEDVMISYIYLNDLVTKT